MHLSEFFKNVNKQSWVQTLSLMSMYRLWIMWRRSARLSPKLRGSSWLLKWKTLYLCCQKTSLSSLINLVSFHFKYYYHVWVLSDSVTQRSWPRHFKKNMCCCKPCCSMVSDFSFFHADRKFCFVVMRFWFLSSHEGPDDPEAIKIFKVASGEGGDPQKKIATAVYE